MISILLNIVGITLILGVAYFISTEKNNISWKTVGITGGSLIALAFLMIKTPLWKVVEMVANGFTWIIYQSSEGINFVFGGALSEGWIFFIGALLPIVFISALIGIMAHTGLLKKFISGVGKTVAKALNIDTTVAVNTVGNLFLGQSESLFLTKTQLPKASNNVVFATLVTGMATISASIIGTYAGMGADIKWIIASMPLQLLAALTVTQIIAPTPKSTTEELVEVEVETKSNLIETMMDYAFSGFQSVIGIAVALMVFLSLVAFINNFIGLFLPGVTIQSVLGIVFTPVALLLGVTGEEVGIVSQLIATKLVTNEAVAFASPNFAILTESTKAVMTIILCGFAGIGSIGILLGGYSAIAKNKVNTVSKLGVKALLTATFVNILTGLIVAMVIAL
jgi:Nucleoside permease